MASAIEKVLFSRVGNRVVNAVLDECNEQRNRTSERARRQTSDQGCCTSLAFAFCSESLASCHYTNTSAAESGDLAEKVL